MNRLRSAGWRAEVIAALAAALLAVVLFALGEQRAWPLALAVGERDARFIGGFHEPEHFGGMTARWTDGAATLLLPRPPASAPPR